MSSRRPEGGRTDGGVAPDPVVSPSGFEFAVLLVGLSLSIAAGFMACRAAGPYGDGPFGAGFRRIPAASGRGTILVHDSRVGPDVLRSVVDERTGRVRELRMAPGGDFAAAVRVYLDEDRRAWVPRDLDGDGVADRWEYYADVRRMAAGAVEKLGFSLAGDEIVDSWVFRDEQGEVSRVEVSTLRDGVVDRWEHYSGGELVRVETDRDRDGRVDHWSTYRGGILSATASDGDGDGLPDGPPAGGR